MALKKMEFSPVLKAVKEIASKYREKKAGLKIRAYSERLDDALYSVREELFRALDDKGRLKDHSKYGLKSINSLEELCVELANIENTTKQVVRAGIKIDKKKALEAVEKEDKVILRKRSELVKEYGTIASGYGRYYFLKFLIEERIKHYLKSIGAESAKLKEKYGLGGK